LLALLSSFIYRLARIMKYLLLYMQIFYLISYLSCKKFIINSYLFKILYTDASIILGNGKEKVD